MTIFDLQKCREIVAGDRTILRELFNPLKQDLQLRCSLAHARVKPGQITRLHKLKTSEVYYILEGTGEMHINDETEAVHTNQAIYIPPGSHQRIKNTGGGELVFLCIVDPAWRQEDEEVLE
ncbi:MAG: cupin domain-containing protein [candidate division Zixibacteria bacterium]|nr:cupin domain-containing protein [candidate division Zixibacteria bacterium]